jgi:hypothetical protein
MGGKRAAKGYSWRISGRAGWAAMYLISEGVNQQEGMLP